MPLPCLSGMEDEQRYWELIKGHFQTTNSVDQEKELENWIKDDSNRDFFLHCIQILKASQIKEPQFNEEGRWQEFLDKTSTEKPLVGWGDKFKIVRIAAIVVFSIGLLFLGYQLTTGSSVTITAENEIVKAQLPDSSIVWLKSGSEITYNNEFGRKTRDITLTGQAFFDVRKDATRPFIIHTPNTSVEVVGTSFDLKTIDDSDELSVVTGRVKIRQSGSGSELTVGPGTQVMAVREKMISKETNTLSTVLSWKPKDFNFNHTSLEDVVYTLEAHYGINITTRVENNQCTFTGTYSDASYLEILRALSLTLNLTIQSGNDQIILSGNGCYE